MASAIENACNLNISAAECCWAKIKRARRLSETGSWGTGGLVLVGIIGDKTHVMEKFGPKF